MIEGVVLCGLGIITVNHLILASGAVFLIGVFMGSAWVLRSVAGILRRIFGV